MRVGNSFKRKDITAESMKLKGTMDVDPSLRAALTDADEGIFRPGALPKMQTSSTGGNKMLLDAVEKAGACGWDQGLCWELLIYPKANAICRFLFGYHGYPIFPLEIAHTISHSIRTPTHAGGCSTKTEGQGQGEC